MMGWQLRFVVVATVCAGGGAAASVTYVSTAAELAAAVATSSESLEIVVTQDLECSKVYPIVFDSAGRDVTVSAGTSSGTFHWGGNSACCNGTAGDDKSGSDARCFDDDECLQGKPKWGSSYFCASSTEYCDDWFYKDAMLDCCQRACGECGFAECPGGTPLLEVSAGSLTLVDATFARKTVSPVRVSGDGALALVNCNASGNSANEGGVVVADGHAVVRVVGGSYQGNAAANEGGVFHVFGNAMVTISGAATFAGNSAVDRGGVALLEDEAALALTGGAYTSNEAAYGGVFFARDDSAVTVSGAVLFSANVALGHGDGGIVRDDAILDVFKDADGAAPTFTGHSSHSVFMCSGATMTISDGLFTENKGAWEDSYGSVLQIGMGCAATITGGTFSHNSASHSGVVHVYGSPTSDTILRVTGGNFVGNFAEVDGGVASIRNGGAVVIEGGTFVGNECLGVGGVFKFYDGTLAVSGGVFENNVAADGGVFGVQADVEVTGGTFQHNVARNRGGVFYVYDYIAFSESDSQFGHLDWRGGSYRNNSAYTGGVLHTEAGNHGTYMLQNVSLGRAIKGAVVYCASDCSLDGGGSAVLSGGIANSGGAICIAAGLSLTVTGVVFRDNRALYGGDINLDSFSSATISDCSSYGALAGNFGGFALLDYLAVMSLSNMTVEGAFALEGGAIKVSILASLHAVDCSFKDCAADAEGGAIQSGRLSSVSVARSTFVDVGAAGGGAALFLEGGDTAALEDVVIVGARGDAIAVALQTVSLVNVSVSGTLAYGDTDGRALSVEHSYGVTCVGCDFRNNEAGAVEVSASALDVANSTFAANTAVSGGALKASDGAVITSAGGNVFADNVASGDGGVLHLSGGAAAALRSDDVVKGNIALGGGAIAYLDATTIGSLASINVTQGAENVATYGDRFATGIATIHATHLGYESSGFDFESTIVVVALDYFSQLVRTTPPIFAVELSCLTEAAILSGSVGSNFNAGEGAAVWDPSVDRVVNVLDAPGSNVMLRATLTASWVVDLAFNQSSGISDYVSDFVVRLSDCVPGQVLDTFGDGSLCATCALGEFWYWRKSSEWSEEGVCMNCHRGMVCEDRGLVVEDVAVKSGHYRATTRSTHTYTCRSGKKGCPGTTNQTGEARCAQGYEGVICGSCAKDYFEVHNLGGLRCRACETRFKNAAIVVCSLVMVAVASTFLWSSFTESGASFFLAVADTAGGAADDVVALVNDVEEDAPPTLATSVTKLKVVIGFFQIISSIPNVFGARLNLPNAFSSLSELAGVVTGIDFAVVVPLRCVYADVSFEVYYARWLVATLLVPILCALFIAAAYVVHRLALRALGRDEAKAIRRRRRRICCQIVLLFLHIIVPMCAFASVSALVAEDYDYGDGSTKSFLRSAPGVSTDASFYLAFIRPLAALGVALYPVGVPCLYSVLLYRYRNVLNPVNEVPVEIVLSPGSSRRLSVDEVFRSKQGLDHQLAVYKYRDRLVHADEGHIVQAFQFLWVDYEPRVWWWEIPEVLRRLFFTALLAVVATGSKLQLAVGVAVSFFYTAFYISFQPFVSDDDDRLADLTGWAITTTLFTCLLLRARIGFTPQSPIAITLLFVAAFVPLVGFAWVLRKLVVRTKRTRTEDDAFFKKPVVELAPLETSENHDDAVKRRAAAHTHAAESAHHHHRRSKHHGKRKTGRSLQDHLDDDKNLGDDAAHHDDGASAACCGPLPLSQAPC